MTAQDQTKKVVAIASDDKGYELKNRIADVLEALGMEVRDYGTFGFEAVDAAGFAHAVSNAIVNLDAGVGILISGMGNTMAIAANKYPGVRAAICWNVEVAANARKQDNANILCLPAQFVTVPTAEMIVKQFLNTRFEASDCPPQDDTAETP